MLRLVQLSHPQIGRRVAVVTEPTLRPIQGVSTLFDLADAALRSGKKLSAYIDQLGFDEPLDYDSIYSQRSEWTLLPPIDHPQDSARCLVTGTGLTHKASADNRQSMHDATAPVTDSMRMFRIGLEGGRPAPGDIGAQPEWFYKGTGSILRGHNQTLDVPNFGFDGGDEAEIAGVYFIAVDGTPHRIGLVQSNEFSDHVLESQNYLYLAPSKLRSCSIGPEILIGSDLNGDLRGSITVERAGKPFWRADLRSGHPNMCHTVPNLEHHHFKYESHRRPGDLHVHFFGADVFSFRDRVRLENHDVMVVSFDGFGRPLRNPLRIDPSPPRFVPVEVL
ncbi:MAG TPA: AraD1 family protein [Tepidisphaeraceae bacterium]|jgi:hypothetical protein|nr:AraD1 family protein [Tepidisphaeraceae bacterium]